MITIIHGTDTVASRKYFLEEKQKLPEAQLLDGEKVTLTDFTQIFEGGGLFEENKTVFVEHFFNRKKSRKAGSSSNKTLSDFDILADYLQKQTTHTIYLWEGKELEKSTLTNLKTAVPRVFKLPQTLFVFLDNLAPGNGKQLIKLFHQTIETTDPEMIFFMLVRQIRLLLAVSSPRHSGEHERLQNPDSGQARMTDEPIDELKRLAPWQQTKLQQQAKLFGTEKLKSIYNHLFLIETGQKTGTLSNSILTNIDFLLLQI